MTAYIIIGNGVAGNAAAESIRRNDQEGEIHIFSREKTPFYYVPALPEVVAGRGGVPLFSDPCVCRGSFR